MRKILIAACFCVTVVSVNAGVTIRLGTEAPKGSTWYNILSEMGYQWSQATQGEVQLKIYAGGILGDEADMIRKMRIGQLNAAAISDSGLADIDSSAYALMIPLFYRSYEEWDFVRSQLNESMETSLEKKGFQVLTWSDVGWVHIFSRERVVLPTDLQRMKLASPLSKPKAVEILKWSGFNAIPISTSDLITGLKTGLIDALLVPLILAEGSNLYRDASCLSMLQWSPLQGALIVRNQDWQMVPEKFRARLLEIARASGDKLKAETRSREMASLEAMRSRGLKVSEIDADALNEWRRVAAKAYPRIREELVHPELFNRVEALVQEYRRAHNVE